MKTVLITGSAGFVGSHIVEEAINSGYSVIGLDNLSSGINYINNNPNYKFINLDVNSNLKDILVNVDCIVHAAAYAELRHNWDDISERKKLFENNEKATINILEQMPNVPFVFLSSGSVYGSLSFEKIKDRALVESDATPDLVQSPYAASKLACEGYVAAWSHKRNNKWYCLRLVNQIGDRAHRGVIVDFLKMIKEKNHIHAADDGSQKKSWVSVKDTSKSIIRLLDSDNPVPSGIYNVSSDERWSWKDMVNVMREMYLDKYPSNENMFSLSNEDSVGGSIGDPLNLNISNTKLSSYYKNKFSVKSAVIDSLSYLGWCK